MPLLSNPTTKQWGKVDKAFLYKRIVNGYVNIEDLSLENINSVQAWYFTHHCTTQRIFRCNFKYFAAAFDLELGLARARQESSKGKMRV
jgi:hypothetical protein